jgi:hypothetical protein
VVALHAAGEHTTGLTLAPGCIRLPARQRFELALTDRVVAYSTASPVTFAAGTATPPSL